MKNCYEDHCHLRLYEWQVNDKEIQVRGYLLFDLHPEVVRQTMRRLKNGYRPPGI